MKKFKSKERTRCNKCKSGRGMCGKNTADSKRIGKQCEKDLNSGKTLNEEVKYHCGGKPRMRNG